MIALILLKKIVAFFIIMIGGATVTKLGILRGSDSKVLSKIFIYLLMPCAILSSFRVDYNPGIRTGLFFVTIVAILIHVIYLVMNEFFKRVLKLKPSEQMTIMYPACGNLTIPLVAAIMGPEMVIYTMGYMSVQIIMLFCHAKSVISGQKKIDLKPILLNPNMISIFLGIILFFGHIPLPEAADDAIATLGGMMGPFSVLIAGMLLAEVDIKKLLSNGRMWLVTLLRLVVTPLIFMCLMKFTPVHSLVADGEFLLLIVLMGIITPPASMITQLTQVYANDDEEAAYTSALNVMSMIFCLITMPILVALYSM